MARARSWRTGTHSASAGAWGGVPLRGPTAGVDFKLACLVLPCSGIVVLGDPSAPRTVFYERNLPADHLNNAAGSSRSNVACEGTLGWLAAHRRPVLSHEFLIHLARVPPARLRHPLPPALVCVQGLFQMVTTSSTR